MKAGRISEERQDLHDSPTKVDDACMTPNPHMPQLPFLTPQTALLVSPLALLNGGQFGSRVSAEPEIDFTFLGTPYFHSMVARSLASLSDISVIIDPETILLPDFILALSYAHKLDHDWLLVSSSRHVSYFPFHLDKDGKHWLGEDGNQIKTRKLQGFLDKAWKWKHCEERMLLAWNNGDLPLHSGVLPPFLFGKGLHNSWVINEALSSKYRFVFDASLAISNFYLNPLDKGSYLSFGVSNVTNSGNRSWESAGNLQLGSLYGALYFHEANYSNMVKFCMNNGQYLFVNSAEATAYPFRHQRSLILRKEKILGSRIGKKVADCVNGFKSLHDTRDCYVKDQLKPSNSLSLPYSLEMLLYGLSDKNRTVVLAIAGYNYKDMLMSWVCRLKSLLISNFLVCALDPEIYEFAILQGLPVFKDSLAPTNISFNDCHFGTQCFQRVTKVKSRLVLQILKLGYNVLLSDVDVYWFKNPLPFLYSFGPSVLVAQSDEYNQTGPINVPRRLNSGFYFARNDVSTVAALEKVVKHAATSNLSEQPSFYDTLCGEGGSNRVGHDRCFEPETNLTVHFLDRDLFPNGAYQGLWEGTNPKTICKKKGCFILHNNWISGRRKKLERQMLLVYLVIHIKEKIQRSGIIPQMTSHEHALPKNLPHDANKLLAVPSPIGGVLVLSANTVHYHSQSASCMLALNNFAVSVGSSQEVPRSSFSVELDAANATWLLNDVAMLSTKTGELLLLTLVYDGRSVRWSVLEHVIFLGCSICHLLISKLMGMATLGNSLFFLGSRLGDSLLVQFSCGIGASALPHGLKEEVADVEGEIPSAKRLRRSPSDALLEMVNGEELSLYGSGPSNAQSAQKTFSFAVRDSLINVGPLKDFSNGLRVNTDLSATGIAKQSNYELVCCSGHGKNGTLCVPQQSIRPETITQEQLPGCKGLWTVYHKNTRSHSVDSAKMGLEDDEYHAYLIISLETRTMGGRGGRRNSEDSGKRKRKENKQKKRQARAKQLELGLLAMQKIWAVCLGQFSTATKNPKERKSKNMLSFRWTGVCN
ncbi:hypothetical protein RHMOL_Rhmol12G0042400 [Rhododendron molle]|uniref:Uncharacterized protein n=1 Tax=Rhododendron molle TaxID=49168 RepID=A0ACC0LEI5_RHOML|nr:hypothetical protein RHMOL_Rhmol12G0042400 [Rhododendron molle]